MKTMILIKIALIFLASIHTACNNQPTSVPYVKNKLPSEVHDMVTFFELKTGKTVNTTILFYSFSRDAEGIEKDWTGFCDLGTNTVHLNSDTWYGFNDETKDALVLHELFHCEFEQAEHDQEVNYLNPGATAYLMSPNTRESGLCVMVKGLDGCLSEAIERFYSNLNEKGGVHGDNI